MENKKILIIVDKDKDLINKLVKIALKNDFYLDDLHAPCNVKRISKKIAKEMGFWITETTRGYSSRFLRFSREKNNFEITFWGFIPENWRNKKILNGHDKEQLDQAIAWINKKEPPK